MITIKIRTAQNVEIEYEVANVADRIGATLIDYIIFASYAFAIFLIWTLLKFKPSEDLMIILFVVLPLPVLCYDLLCEIFLDGQSFGKKALNIKVVRLDGSRPSVNGYLLRWIMRLFDTVLTSGSLALLAILLNGKGQRIGDLAAGTTIIRTKDKVRLDDTIFLEIDSKYKPQYAIAKTIDEEAISIIKEALDFNKKNKSSVAGKKVLEETKNALEAVYAIKSEQPAQEFLAAVLQDYNHYHGIV